MRPMDGLPIRTILCTSAPIPIRALSDTHARHAGAPVRKDGVTVLCLGGQARSGSTLLDRALGQVPGICSAGEVRYLWDRGIRDNQRCGCGEAFLACPFWSQVGQAAFGGWNAVDLDEVLGLQAQVDRAGALPRLLVPRGRFARSLERYAAYLERVFSAASEVSGSPVIVDSSMSPPHGLALKAIDGVDLRCVHLVRDARGVAYSSAKEVARPEITDRTEYMPTYPPLQAGLRWSAANLVYEAMGYSVPTLRVRYESFVREPRDTLAAIAAHVWLTLEEDDLGFIEGDTIHLGVDHTAAGNPMRFRTGPLPLRVDEAWRDELDVGDRRTVTAVAWPFLRRYGYLGHHSGDGVPNEMMSGPRTEREGKQG